VAGPFLYTGTIGSHCKTDAARFTQANVDLCFPQYSESERDALCRESLTHMSLLFFEVAHLRYIDEQALLGRIREVVGKDEMDAAVAEQRGVLLLVPHFGCWEYLSVFLGVNYGFAALYERPKVAGIEPVILAIRERFGSRLFATDTGGMRGLFKALKGGAVSIILPDQVPDEGGGVHVDFFAQPALTMTLVHRIIDKLNPNVLLCSVRRTSLDDNDPYGFQVVFEPLRDLPTADATECMARINAIIEAEVMHDPPQYQWEYKRFKRPPGGGKNPIYLRQ